MKKFLILIILCFCGYGVYAQNDFAYAEGDYDGFTNDMRASEKNYLVYYSAAWCAPCKLFQKETLGDATVAKYLKENYAVYKVDVDKNRELKTRYKVAAIPTIIVFDSTGKEVYRFTSYVSARKFLRTLKMFD